ncbi:hypothetical protein Rxycam_02315 [Rubrobacter xylanophilus DSM 9941]|uniref:hypothetical protein n=1 Tax=Rubrobacter xylanophilus TaxID=49319 RepID=UPI001C640689|nr:hypothetical protein [Rubrobacter xylanophilus]QYJ16482.1 hypothetical protein Rxycam_02315 [Rubrobacter xylanophilus DSM 9941]
MEMAESKNRLVLTTCGTSLLTNGVDQEVRARINQLANHTERDLSAQDKELLDQHIDERSRLLSGTKNLDEIRSLSAELNGLITCFGGDLKPSPGRPDAHILLTSDTYLGHRIGEIIDEWLQSRGFSVQVWSPGGLTTRDREDFRHAMADLVLRCEQTLPGYRESGYRIVFNLTGGFKSIQGFMQTLGMFHADEMFYIFETGSSLITIPRLPVSLETGDLIRKHEQIFRRLGLGEELPLEECRGLPEILLFDDGQKAILSEWGQLVWQRSKWSLYSERLLDPLPGLRYSSNFRKKVRGLNLSPDRLATLNERLDELSLRVRGKRENLKSLDFKQLKGNPKPPSTHECDVWSDDERRLFGHYENETFVIDDIERGLH